MAHGGQLFGMVTPVLVQAALDDLVRVYRR
jgi:hypothetical protein